MRTSLLLAVVAVALAACGDRPPPSPAAPPPSPPATAAAAGPTAAGPAPSAPAGRARVRLLEPGVEPRRPLRYAFASGTRRTLALSQRQVLRVDGRALSDQTVTSRLSLEVVEVGADGTARVVGRSGDVRVEGGAAPTAAALSALSMSFRARVAASGAFEDVDVSMDAEVADPALRAAIGAMGPRLAETLRDLGVPLPAEPVGVGARWVQEATAPTAGLSAEARAEVVLEAWDGATARLRSKSSIRGGPQPFVLPGSARRLDVEGIDGDGEGTTTIDLAAPGATGTTGARTRMRMRSPSPRPDGAAGPVVEAESEIEQTVKAADG